MASNIFEAKCDRCGKMVPPGEGLVSGRVGRNWRVIHNSCIPSSDRRIIKGLEYDL